MPTLNGDWKNGLLRLNRCHSVMIKGNFIGPMAFGDFRMEEALTIRLRQSFNNKTISFVISSRLKVVASTTRIGIEFLTKLACI